MRDIKFRINRTTAKGTRLTYLPEGDSAAGFLARHSYRDDEIIICDEYNTNVLTNVRGKVFNITNSTLPARIIEPLIIRFAENEEVTLIGFEASERTTTFTYSPKTLPNYVIKARVVFDENLMDSKYYVSINNFGDGPFKVLHNKDVHYIQFYGELFEVNQEQFAHRMKFLTALAKDELRDK